MLYGASALLDPTPTAPVVPEGRHRNAQLHADPTEDDDEDPLGASTRRCSSVSGTTFRAGSKVWLTPFANLIVSTSGNLTSGNSIVTDASFSLMQIGAAVTWR